MVLGTRSLVVGNEIIAEIFRGTNNIRATVADGGPKRGVTPSTGCQDKKPKRPVTPDTHVCAQETCVLGARALVQKHGTLPPGGSRLPEIFRVRTFDFFWASGRATHEPSQQVVSALRVSIPDACSAHSFVRSERRQWHSTCYSAPSHGGTRVPRETRRGRAHVPLNGNVGGRARVPSCGHVLSNNTTTESPARPLHSRALFRRTWEGLRIFR